MRTLTEVLAKLGYTHTRTTKYLSNYKHDVINSSGEVVFTGDANEVWQWINANGK